MIRLFLCGDVMIGRGIDQVMRHSVEPRLFEPHVSSAEAYVDLAERANGPIPRPVGPAYVWGEALDVIRSYAPHVSIVNLETAVTTSAARWPGKEVLYRTHPANVAVLRAAGIDCCVLANNHVLDCGGAGLVETLDSLHGAGLATAGAGHDLAEAEAPAIVDAAQRRVIVIGIASTTSGVPREWAAGPTQPGVVVLEGWAPDLPSAIGSRLARVRRPGDVVVASIHWGSNWGYEIPPGQRRLAHDLIDKGGVHLVHGHSSHHPRPMEVYRGHLILYGCGDFINDYEGISGYEEYRDDLVLAYLLELDSTTGRMVSLTIAPFQLKRFQLVTPSATDVGWLARTMTHHSRPFGVSVTTHPGGVLRAAPRDGLSERAPDR
jgi:poly-gamma-glutamate synthesis protein (capsule biosynthesis protein)